MKLQDAMEVKFDPSDTDNNMQLAYAALRLSALTVQLCFAVGRFALTDQVGLDPKLESAIAEVGQRLTLLQYAPSSKDVLQYIKELSQETE